MTIFDYINDSFYLNYAAKFTNCKDSAHDLVMETALIIHDKKYPLTNPKGLFCRIAKNLYLQQKKHVSLDFDISDFNSEKSDIPDLATLNEILSKPHKNKREFVTREIFKLYIKLGTEQAVSDFTNIPRQTVNSQISKFKQYARNYFNNQ